MKSKKSSPSSTIPKSPPIAIVVPAVKQVKEEEEAQIQGMRAFSYHSSSSDEEKKPRNPTTLKEQTTIPKDDENDDGHGS